LFDFLKAANKIGNRPCFAQEACGKARAKRLLYSQNEFRASETVNAKIFFEAARGREAK